MNEFALAICILVIGFPVAWIVSEFQSRRWLRLILGATAIVLSSAGVATIVAELVVPLERLRCNAWFGGATKNLIDATVAELEGGNRDGVLRSLTALQQKYSPTYENRASYDILIEETVAQMRAGKQQSP